MSKKSTRAAAVRSGLVLVLVGVGACTPAPVGSTDPTRSPAPTGSAVSSPSAPVGFPAEAQRRAMETAEHEGWSPAGGASVLVRWNDEEVPHLLWQTAASGDICMANPIAESSVSVSCEKASEILAAPSPGVRWILTAALNNRQDSWNLVLLASDETLDEISCGTQDFRTRKVLVTTIGGVTRTVYSVTVPWALGGTYRATVQRAGQGVPDTLQIRPEAQVQC